MKKRIITASVLVLILVPVIFIDSQMMLYLFDSILILLALGAEWELLHMYDKEKKIKLPMKIVSMALMLVLFASIVNYFPNHCQDSFVISLLQALHLNEILTPFVGIFIVFLVLMALLVLVPDYSVTDLGKLFISVIYIGVCASSLLILRHFGRRYIAYLLSITVFTDTFALVFGMLLGKHKMAPIVSPKKTWEGAIGGTLVATVVSFIILFFYKSWFSQFFHGAEVDFFYNTFDYDDFQVIGKVIFALILGIFLSACGQIGDLVASKLKRKYGIKDYSNIFPGHGGVLDRFDSAFFAAAIFLLFIIIENNMFPPVLHDFIPL